MKTKEFEDSFNFSFTMDTEGDFNEEIARQEKKLGKLQNERKSLEGRINNPKFVANAPADLIKQTKERIEEILVQERAINELIDSLKA